MIDTTPNMDAYRLKIKQYLSDKGWTQQALVRLTGYPKQDVSAILLGKQKGTPYANIFITAVCEAYKINWPLLTKARAQRSSKNMNRLNQAISQSKNSKPYYHKIIIDLLVQLTTEGKYRSLTAFKKSGDKLTTEQKETLRAYTDSIICMLQAGLAFHEIKEFLTKEKAVWNFGRAKTTLNQSRENLVNSRALFL